MGKPTPYVTGNSVVAIKYKGGVVVATDKRLSYGKMHLSNSATRQLQLT